MMDPLDDLPLATLLKRYPYTRPLFDSLGVTPAQQALSLHDWLTGYREDQLLDQGWTRAQVQDYLHCLIQRLSQSRQQETPLVKCLTLLGGHDKNGRPERVKLTVRPGDILCLVGPTGAGKSRLLADIECLAQQDTPSGRQILLNHQIPDRRQRFNLEHKLVAQISQNMNFVVDLTVQDFLTMHARSRQIQGEADVVQHIIDCANQLTGEPFNRLTPITQLSGGQSRALMIADTALLSRSPIILIDEIENAGVDRRRALELLVKQDKIVLIATHDPLLALIGTYRLVIRNGGIAAVLDRSPQEQRNIAVLEAMDSQLMALRQRIRAGERINEQLQFVQEEMPCL